METDLRKLNQFFLCADLSSDFQNWLLNYDIAFKNNLGRTCTYACLLIPAKVMLQASLALPGSAAAYEK